MRVRRGPALAVIVVVVAVLLGIAIWRARSQKASEMSGIVALPIFAVHPGAAAAAGVAAAGASHIGLVSIGRTLVDGMNILLTSYYLNEIAHTSESPSRVPVSSPSQREEKNAHAVAVDPSASQVQQWPVEHVITEQ